jgi:hypothetical protein
VTAYILIAVLAAAADFFDFKKDRRAKDIAVYCVCMALALAGGVLYFQFGQTEDFSHWILSAFQGEK